MNGDEMFMGELAEFSTTQTIANAVDDINTHIDSVVDLLSGYTVSSDSDGFPTVLYDAAGETVAVGQDLGELVEVALRTAIARQIEPRP